MHFKGPKQTAAQLNVNSAKIKKQGTVNKGCRMESESTSVYQS